MEQQISFLALNGALILSISLICGRWFAKAIKQQHNEVAWRVVHSGGSMGGIMLLAIAPLLPHLSLPDIWRNALITTLSLGTWLFALAMIAAAITGDRGLSFKGTPTNRSIHIAYFAGSVCCLFACGVLIAGLYRNSFL